MNHHMVRRLIIMSGVSFVAMYVLMYMMVDVFDNVYPNINQFYMALMMTACMVVIELIVMRAMYSKTTYIVGLVISSLLFAGSIAGIRWQIGVSDEAFLRSMIPHHASALLMCEKAQLQDPDITELCNNIIIGQQAEIDWMKSKLLPSP